MKYQSGVIKFIIREPLLKKLSSKIVAAGLDPDKLFYFDDVNIIDQRTNKTIHGAELEADSWNKITKTILDYFNINL